MHRTSLLQLVYDFDSKGNRSAVATLSAKASPAEIFAALHDGYSEWLLRKDCTTSDFQVTVYARERDEAHEQLVRYLVGRWNDAAPPHRAGRIDLMVGNNAQSWFGFTNGSFPNDPAKLQPQVRFFTHDEMIADLASAARAVAERERSRRRENPVHQPVTLPRTIATQLARYLKQEFPDLAAAPCKISARKLALVGEVVIDGVPTQYWSVSDTGGSALWGVVERFDDSYGLSFATELPDSLGEA